MTLNERVGYTANGFRGQIAMTLKADTAEGRELLDAALMSLPLGAAFGITGMEIINDEMRVSVVPEMLEDNDGAHEMCERCSSICQDVFAGVFGGDPGLVSLVAEEIEPPVLAEAKTPRIIIDRT